MENFERPAKLTPSYHGKECLGNGAWVGYEIQCDECEYYLICFPEYDEGELSMDKKMELYVKICDRAAERGYAGDRLSLLMDIESADKVFNLRLEELLMADNANFVHDIQGIVDNINRADGFPAKDFGLFVPRFATP